MKLGSAVFNTVQWIVLDCPASEIRTKSEVNFELFRQITQRTWNSVFAIFMLLYQVYCCRGKAEVLWSSKKPASMYPSVLNYEMTKWVYTHIADRVREKYVMWLQHFLSSISYLKDELSTSFSCHLSLSGSANMLLVRQIQALTVRALCGWNGCQL